MAIEQRNDIEAMGSVWTFAPDPVLTDFLGVQSVTREAPATYLVTLANEIAITETLVCANAVGAACIVLPQTPVTDKFHVLVFGGPGDLAFQFKVFKFVG